MSILKVGDEVMWRGGFGDDPAKVAKVVQIEITEQARSKYGVSVDSVHWDMVKANKTLISLDNGHWCYGEQVSKIAKLNPCLKSS